MSNKNNILTDVLDVLKVKYTKEYLNTYFESFPYRNSLYGLSIILSRYKIYNTALKINDKQDFINNISEPFVAFLNNDFVVVEKINSVDVVYLRSGKRRKISISDFLNNWSGIVLTIERSKFSIEPDYLFNFRHLRILKINKLIFFFCIIFFVTNYVRNYNFSVITLVIANALGAIVSYLIILKELQIYNRIGESICNLLNNKDGCNNIKKNIITNLDSFIRLSDIGVGYFIANIWILSFCSYLYYYCILINFVSISFTFWSILYQKYYIKQWCILCLVVQLLIWLIFFINMSLGYNLFQEMNIYYLIYTGIIYIFFILLVKFIRDHLVNNFVLKKYKIEYNKIKMDENIFKLLLVNNSKIEVDALTSFIQLGDPNASNMLTVVLGLHCKSCSIVHKKICKLLDDAFSYYRVRYIFVVPNEDLNIYSKMLISVYFKKGVKAFELLLDEWYQVGKERQNELLIQNNFDPQDEKIIEEFNAHMDFVNQQKINITPTIFFNGYQLPSLYDIDDLVYFSKVGIN